MFSFWIYTTVLCSSVLPLITFYFVPRKQRVFDVFFYFILFRLLTDLSCLILEQTVKNGNPVFHFSIPINLIFILTLFQQEIKLNKRLLLAIVFGGMLFFFLDLFVTDGIYKFNYFSVLYSYTIISVVGWYYLNKSEFQVASKHYLIPLSIYYTSLIFHALFGHEIEQSKTMYEVIFPFFASLTFLLNVSFVRAIWLKGKEGIKELKNEGLIERRDL